MRRLNKLMKKIKSAVCILLAVVVATLSLCAGSIAVAADGQDQTFDIGVDSGSVTATLNSSGLLTISGSGRIKDFTAETAPFSGLNVKELKIGADIKAIGDYTFYNCGGLTNVISLPKGMISIGSHAFSGDSLSNAAKPIFVDNPFTETTVTRRRDDVAATPAPTAAPTPQPTEAPTAEPTVEPTLAPEDDGTAESDADAGEEISSSVDEAEPETEEIENTQQQTELELNAETPEDTELSSAPETEIQPTAEPTATAEATASPTPAAKYIVETITEQEIGEEIFFPRSDRAVFTCSELNTAFCTAMQSAGYTKADSVANAVFECGAGSSAAEKTVVKAVPVLDGAIILPALPQEFSAPDGGAMFAYSFGGWTESQDNAGTVRAAGSTFTVGERSDLYFIANWNREILTKIEVKREGTELVLSVPSVSGYEFTAFRWQSCLLPPGTAVPKDQSKLEWSDISGATAQTCRRTIQDENGTRLYRCVVIVKKQQNLLLSLVSADSGEEIPLAAVSTEDTVTKISFDAPKSAAGGQKTITQSVSLPYTRTGTYYKMTGAKITGNFNLVLPSENGAKINLPSFTAGQTSGDTFALRVRPTATDWSNTATDDTCGAYVLTSLPSGASAWNSGVTNVWKRGTTYPQTYRTPTLQIDFLYESNYESFVGGDVEITLVEYATEAFTEALNSAVIRVSLDGDHKEAVQSAAVVGGRSFTAITSSAKPSVTSQSAVTALFTTEYQPIVTGSEESILSIYGEDGTAPPSGTKIIMADMSYQGAYQYYFYETSGEAEISLSDFGYAGASSTAHRITEKLLFVVDFSGAGTGPASCNYYIKLTHKSKREEAWATAEFAVTDGGCGLDVTADQTGGRLWSLTVTPSASYYDTRYRDGASVRLRLKDSDGNAAALPQKALVTCSSGRAVHDSDGSVVLNIPINVAVTAEIDFSLVTAELPAGEYSFTAEMCPRTGLHCSGVASDASDELVGYTLAAAETVLEERSIRVSLNAESERLLDASAGEVQLKLDMTLDSLSGDTLDIEVFEKTGTEPDESSYTAADVTGWQISPESASAIDASVEIIEITIPQGQKSGTYRVKLTINSADGIPVAEEVYNFIVK